MNKDLILSIMAHSFKKANIDLAVESGVDPSSAQSQVEAMDTIIKKCMDKVLDDLLENFPNIQNSVG